MLVKNIVFIDNKIEIVFEEKSVFISKENYIENPIAIGSSISESELDLLIRQEKIIESKIQMIKLLNRKALTECEVIKTLKNKEIDSKNISVIVNDLKRVGLINDEYAGMLLVDSLLVKKRGRKEIEKQLKEKGINKNIVNKLISEIDEEEYLLNFNKVCEKYSKIYKTKSSRIKEQMIINKLKEYGYEDEYINSVNIIENNDEELRLAKQNLIKILKNKKMDLNNYENLNKIKSKLVMKGFRYDIINVALEEVMKDEIN